MILSQNGATSSRVEASMQFLKQALMNPDNSVRVAAVEAFGKPSSSVYHKLAPHERVETPAERIYASVASTG